jgi:hypothetical protein
VEIKQEVRTLRTTVDTFIDLVKSDANPAALNAYANQVATNTRLGSVAPSAMSGSEVNTKKTKKKRTKALKVVGPDLPVYEKSERKVVVVSITYAR